ncbi:hypothetical protein [Paraburkholderia acidipaludis]|uniref:hypothetical protein n=1 Tax=Paraburkholderia acidipaludis TaxID=660537 RepID=UPI0012EC0DE6|nr:hypothetical protein [Paraburkholderia acidipaludis]
MHIFSTNEEYTGVMAAVNLRSGLKQIRHQGEGGGTRLLFGRQRNIGGLNLILGHRENFAGRVRHYQKSDRDGYSGYCGKVAVKQKFSPMCAMAHSE